jgi:hypothetical protein
MARVSGFASCVLRNGGLCVRCGFTGVSEFQPIPVADSELGQSLLSVQHEKIAMRQAVDEMGGIKVVELWWTVCVVICCTFACIVHRQSRMAQFVRMSACV